MPTGRTRESSLACRPARAMSRRRRPVTDRRSLGRSYNGPVAGRVSSPIFVGRGLELDRMAVALDDAAGGRSQLLLVGGEAGVGKTRFVEEVVRRARERGGRTLVGGCVEFGGSGLPFLPITEALRSLTVGLEPAQVDDLLGPRRSELDWLLPERGQAPEAERGHGLTGDSAQWRLFDAFLGLLGQLAVDQPILLAVEDLHWADQSTLDLLAYLVRNGREAALVLLVTFRSDELHRRHPLQAFMAELQRTRSTERLELARFDRSELWQQVSHIRGGSIDVGLFDSIHARTDGNAFFAEELLAMEMPAGDLPNMLRDVVLARVAVLSEPARELLRMAAAAGPRISSRLLGRVAGREVPDLVPSLREAVERHILIPGDTEGEETFSFRHALVQEAVYRDLLPGERVRLHAGFAAALAEEAQNKDGRLAAALAFHWYAAHDLPRALEASIQAAADADRAHAFADALSLYERAIELWEQVPNADARTGLDRIAVLERAARAAAASMPSRSLSLIGEALRLAKDTVDDTRLGVLMAQFGRYAWNTGDGITALDACREAVRLVPAGSPTLARARVTANLGQILAIEMHEVEAKAVCEEAVAVSRAIGAEEIESHALNSLGVATVYLGDMDAGLAQLREALGIALRIGSVDDAARAYANLVDVQNHGGRFAEAADLAAEGFAYAESHGLARYFGVAILCEAASALERMGRWAGAAALVDRAQRDEVAGTSEIFIQERLTLLDVGQGRHDVAARRLGHLRTLIERAVEAQWVAPVAEAGAELALWEGRPMDARSEILEAFRRIPMEPGYISRVGVLFALGLRAEADISTLARARRDRDELAESRRIGERHLAGIGGLRDRAVAGLPSFAREAEAWSSACDAEFARLDGSSDSARWTSTADAFGAIPMAYPQAYALWRSAESLLAGTHARSAAAGPLREAHAITLDLGANPLRLEIEALAKRGRIDLSPSAAPAPELPSPLALVGLTSREREVLGLVASGMTNREIAQALFITEGTAGVHVSNILAKLGVRGRTEAAAVAHRLDLGQPPSR